MLDINIIRENPDLVREKISLKGADVSIVDDFLALDKKWRTLVAERDEKKSKQKTLGEEKKIEEAKKIKIEIQYLEEEERNINKKRQELLLKIPNLPDDSALAGQSEKDNSVVKEVGEKPQFDFEPKDHMELGVSLNLINTEIAARVAGARFGYLLNEAALMEFGLITLAMKEAVKEGFTPVVPPVMAKSEIMREMGKGKFLEEGEAFYLPADDLYLVGSAEHTIGPLHMGDILKEEVLPKRYIGFSTAFRREAGSYGKDTKGILRVHQFDKVEMFSFSDPKFSKEEHAFLLSMQERFISLLKLPYRVVEVCTGDMTFGDARQFDVEIWIPSQKTYRETNSCSNTTDYQARGINARLRRKNGEIEFLHMLNATGIAIGRILIAIMENFQTKEGNIKVPEVLQPYVGKELIGNN